MGPGDLVRCVDAKRRPYSKDGGPDIWEGRVYTVAESFPNGYPVPAVSLQEFSDEHLWASDRFCPISPKSKAMIASLLKPIPETVEG